MKINGIELNEQALEMHRLGMAARESFLSPEKAATLVQTLRRQAADPTTALQARRHHHVPRFLLARFSDDGQIKVVTREKSWTTSVENAAVVKDLYTVVHEEGHDTDIVERLFSRIEDEASRLILLLFIFLNILIFVPPEGLIGSRVRVG